LISLLALQFIYILRIDWTKKAKEAHEFADQEQKSKDVEPTSLNSLENPIFHYSNNKTDLNLTTQIDDNKSKSHTSNNKSFKVHKKGLIIKLILFLSVVLLFGLSIYIHESDIVRISYNTTTLNNDNNITFIKS
jgi:hypothetical protein